VLLFSRICKCGYGKYPHSYLNFLKKIKTLNPKEATAAAVATTEQIRHSKNPNSRQ